jgi:hypothetical protein
MRMRLLMLAWGCLLLGGREAMAQPAMPKPGPEHALMKKLAGDWDATVFFMGGQSKATSHQTLDLGGFWLLTDFQGDFGGMEFRGRGTMGYDPIKKKYVSTWVDSMSPSLMVMEGTFSKDGKSFTEEGVGPGPDGKPTKMKSISEFKDDNTILWTMYNIVDGKEQEALKITYQRKK